MKVTGLVYVDHFFFRVTQAHSEFLTARWRPRNQPLDIRVAKL